MATTHPFPACANLLSDLERKLPILQRQPLTHEAIEICHSKEMQMWAVSKEKFKHLYFDPQRDRHVLDQLKLLALAGPGVVMRIDCGQLRTQWGSSPLTYSVVFIMGKSRSMVEATLKERHRNGAVADNSLVL